MFQQQKKRNSILKNQKYINHLIQEFEEDPLTFNISNESVDNKLSICYYMLNKKPQQRTEEEIKLLAQCTKDVKYFANLLREEPKKGQEIHQKCMRHMVLKEVDEFTDVIVQNDYGTTFWVIITGSVQILINRPKREKDANGQEYIINIREEVAKQGPGSCFGELALKNDAKRAATVRTLEKSYFAVLQKEPYKQILEGVHDRKLYMQQFGQVSIFKGWQDIIVKNLYDASVEIEVNYGTPIYLEGDESEYIYFIKSGEFEIRQKVKQQLQQSKGKTKNSLGHEENNNMKRQVFIQKDVKISIFCQNECFGEEEFFQSPTARYRPEKRIYSIYCSSAKGEVYVINKSDFINRAIMSEHNLNSLYDSVKVKQNYRKKLLNLKQSDKIMKAGYQQEVCKQVYNYDIYTDYEKEKQEFIKNQQKLEEQRLQEEAQVKLQIELAQKCQKKQQKQQQAVQENKEKEILNNQNKKQVQENEIEPVQQDEQNKKQNQNQVQDNEQQNNLLSIQQEQENEQKQQQLKQNQNQQNNNNMNNNVQKNQQDVNNIQSPTNHIDKHLKLQSLQQTIAQKPKKLFVLSSSSFGKEPVIIESIQQKQQQQRKSSLVQVEKIDTSIKTQNYKKNFMHFHNEVMQEFAKKSNIPLKEIYNKKKVGGDKKSLNKSSVSQADNDYYNSSIFQSQNKLEPFLEKQRSQNYFLQKQNNALKNEKVKRVWEKNSLTNSTANLLTINQNNDSNINNSYQDNNNNLKSRNSFQNLSNYQFKSFNGQTLAGSQSITDFNYVQNCKSVSLANLNLDIEQKHQKHRKNYSNQFKQQEQQNELEEYILSQENYQGDSSLHNLDKINIPNNKKNNNHNHKKMEVMYKYELYKIPPIQKIQSSQSNSQRYINSLNTDNQLFTNQTQQSFHSAPRNNLLYSQEQKRKSIFNSQVNSGKKEFFNTNNNFQNKIGQFYTEGNEEISEEDKYRKLLKQQIKKIKNIYKNVNDLKVVCFGGGYVGGPTMTIMAQKIENCKFYVYDINEQLIDKWNNNELPVYEKNLQEILLQQRGKNLFFISSIQQALENTDIIFIAVNTPTKKIGIGYERCLDTQSIENSIRQISSFYNQKQMEKPIIIVEKSTVPVTTCQLAKQIFNDNQTQFPQNKNMFSIISNPEFMAEGSAVTDLLNPDRVIIGGFDENENQKNSVNLIKELYKKWVPEEKIIQTNIFSSELSKIVANSFLAQRISSINSITPICEAVNADILEISKSIGFDTRIGNKFLNCSVGFGGSCFKKDILCLVYLAESLGLQEVATYWEGVLQMNEYQKLRFSNKIIKAMYNSLVNKQLTILGMAFKKDTNDVRESPAISVCHQLLKEGAILKIYDPQVKLESIIKEMQQQNIWEEQFQDKIVKIDDIYKGSKDSHAIVILTEWDMFKSLDYQQLYENMKRPSFFFDGRNLLDKSVIKKIGFIYFSLGRN